MDSRVNNNNNIITVFYFIKFHNIPSNTYIFHKGEYI